MCENLQKWSLFVSYTSSKLSWKCQVLLTASNVFSLTGGQLWGRRDPSFHVCHSSCKQDQDLALLENIYQLLGSNAPLRPSSLPRFCLYVLFPPDPKQEWLSLSAGNSGFALLLLFKSNYLLRALLLASAFWTQEWYKTWFFPCLWIFWGICTFLS